MLPNATYTTKSGAVVKTQEIDAQDYLQAVIVEPFVLSKTRVKYNAKTGKCINFTGYYNLDVEVK